jgi:sulfoxide reductase heme-binding subunit YedZ
MPRSWWKPAKIGLWVVCFAPGVWLLWAVFNDGLSANPVDDIRDYTGRWTLRLLMLTLAVTPLRQITGWNDATRFRRMLGLFAFWYAFVHFFTYLWLDQFFDWRAIGEDIVERAWITAGIAGFLSMIPLALTSTKGWIARLGGKRWQLLHRLTYVAAGAGVLHYLWVVKLDSTYPLRYAMVLALLLGYRVWYRYRKVRTVGAGTSPRITRITRMRNEERIQ